MDRLKKGLALVLSILTVFTLFACTANDTPDTTELGPEVVEKKDYSQYANIVADPKTWYDEFMALPIANENMTEDELRQLCADAFKANMTFQWTPNKEIVYDFELLDRISQISLQPGIAYSGLAYATGKSSGNLWKILNYYDKETGVLDVEAMDPNKVMGIVTSACARGAEQGWNRVSGNHGLDSMSTFNRFDSNVVPVGPYTYEQADYNYAFGSRTASNEIIAKNGEQVMYESYAMMKTADGLYSSSSWHVMMASSKAEVVRYADGTINAAESYILVHEQDAVGTKTDNKNITQSNGVVLRQLGTIDNKYTFKKLVEKGYIPFTLKEFIGEDPIEPGEAWLGTQTEKMENGLDLTVQELFGNTLHTNYNLCNVRVEVKAPDGTALVSYNPELQTRPNTYSTTMTGALDEARVTPYANGKNTIHIYARIANGELIEVYNTILKTA